MSIQTVDAIYEHGVLRLVEPEHIRLDEGQRVRIVIEAEPSSAAILDLALSVYDGLTEQVIAEVEAIAVRREPFFRKSE